MGEMKVSATGMVWYEEKDYERLRSMFTDGANLPRTYAEWLQKATTGEHHLKSQGTFVARVLVRPDEFAAWCKAEGLPMGALARNKWASNGALEAYRASKGH